MPNTNQALDIKYYFESRPIGLFVLFTSLREQPTILNNFSSLTSVNQLIVITDWIYIFEVMKRLKSSLIAQSRWNIALDATSFFLFIRIYYDSLSHLIHLLFKAMNPSCSQKWPKAHSFSDQLKWFGKQSNNQYFAEYNRCLAKYGFSESFMNMRKIRNLIKTAPMAAEPARMVWLSKDLYPITGNLRNEVGRYLYECLKFTDFLGDYFLMKIEEMVPIQRMETDHHGYERGHLPNNHLEIYKWFNDMQPNTL